jgi:hypothetical protein
MTLLLLAESTAQQAFIVNNRLLERFLAHQVSTNLMQDSQPVFYVLREVSAQHLVLFSQSPVLPVAIVLKRLLQQLQVTQFLAQQEPILLSQAERQIQNAFHVLRVSIVVEQDKQLQQEIVPQVSIAQEEQLNQRQLR